MIQDRRGHLGLFQQYSDHLLLAPPVAAPAAALVVLSMPIPAVESSVVAVDPSSFSFSPSLVAGVLDREVEMAKM